MSSLLTSSSRTYSEIVLSHRMNGIKSSAVREILKVTEHPEIISFAGGLPAPEYFPVDAIAAAFQYVLSHDGAASLQYSTTEGFPQLRKAISDRLNRQGGSTTPDDLLITNGSQQGLDLIAKVLINPSDVIVVENPSYLAALQAFGFYEAQFAVVESDDEGMIVDDLEAIVLQNSPKMLYVVPNYNNPTGRTLTLSRRIELVRLAQKYRFIILEDNPYGELCFDGDPLPSLASLDNQGVVVSLGTFSKTFAPGLRVGWLSGPTKLVKAMTVAKQSTDLHTSSISQRVIAHLLATFDYEGHIAQLRKVYGERAQAMISTLETALPKGSKWSRPKGGMFVWVQLPTGYDTDRILEMAIENKIAFVPGRSFFANEPQIECMRLNFSNQPVEKITEGIKRLGLILQDC